MVRRSNKKGDISIAVIIGAAIALFVLVIVSVLILNAGDSVVTRTSCDGMGGTCRPTEGENSGCNTDEIRGTGSCSTPNTVCCMESPLGRNNN